MTQWALPTADLADGSWTNELDTQTDLFESVNEAYASASATDYIQSPTTAANDACQFSMDGIYSPVAGTVKLVVKAQWGTAADTTTLTWQYIAWDEDASATSYVLQIGTATGDYDTYNNNVGNVLTYARPLAAGTYYVRVVPYDGSTALTASAEQTVVVT